MQEQSMNYISLEKLFENDPLVSLLLRITAVQMSLVAAIMCEFVYYTRASAEMRNIMTKYTSVLAIKM